MRFYGNKEARQRGGAPPPTLLPLVMSAPLLMEANKAFRLSAAPPPPEASLMSMGGGGPGGGGGGQPPAGTAEAEATGPWSTQAVSKLVAMVTVVRGLREAHALVPAQAGGVVLFDVALQVSPDGDVSLHPVHVDLVPAESRATVTRSPRRITTLFPGFRE